MIDYLVYFNSNKMYFSIVKILKQITYNFIDSFDYYSSDATSCEIDYVKFNEVAEFWNTITSFFIIFVGLYGLRHRNKNLMLFYMLLSCVGFSSVLFHLTLSFVSQIFNEIMITLFMLLGNYVLYSEDIVGMKLINTFLIIQIIVQFVYPEYNRFMLFFYVLTFINKFWNALRSRDKKTKFYAQITMGLFIVSVICWISDFYICGIDTIFNFHGLWHIFIGLTSYFAIETWFLFLNNVKYLKNKNQSKTEYWYSEYEQ